MNKKSIKEMGKKPGKIKTTKSERIIKNQKKIRKNRKNKKNRKTLEKNKR